MLKVPNIIIIIITTTIIGIVLYIIIDSKAVFTNIASITGSTIKDKQSIIQSTVEAYTRQTSKNLMTNLSKNKKVVAGTSKIAASIIKNIINNVEVQTNAVTASMEIISKPTVTSSVMRVITGSVGSGLGDLITQQLENAGDGAISTITGGLGGDVAAAVATITKALGSDVTAAITTDGASSANGALADGITSALTTDPATTGERGGIIGGIANSIKDKLATGGTVTLAPTPAEATACLIEGTPVTAFSVSVNGTGNKACCNTTWSWSTVCAGKPLPPAKQEIKKAAASDCLTKGTPVTVSSVSMNGTGNKACCNTTWPWNTVCN